MCGICGVAPFDNNCSVDPLTLQRMADIMLHRGPDSDGFHLGPGVGLGIRRLSIIDLETGDQPISSEDGNVTVVCNGEIYNYPELRRKLLATGHRFRTGSDVEVIVHLYEQHGAECLEHLRGMFAAAIWDRRKGSLLLARDRLGIKPLYYAMGTDALLFGSEQKSLLATGMIERRPDPLALHDLFTYGFITGARTLFTSIRQLLPGHYMIYKNGNTTIRKYWDVRFPAEPLANSMSVAEWGEALLEKLKETVRIHMRSDVAVGAWLSSGLDSSGIVSLMSRFTDHQVQTFSLGFENPDFDEIGKQPTLDTFPGYRVTNQRALMRSRDFEQLPKALWHSEDITTSGLEIPRMILSELTSRSVKVVMTGEGADEVFGGYGWFHADKLLRPLAVLPLFLRRLMLLGDLLPRLKPIASRVHLAPGLMGPERYRYMVGPPHPEVLDQLFSGDVKGSLGDPGDAEDWVAPPADFPKWHPFTQLQYYEMKVRLPGFIIHHLDRISMAHSLEARVPFLDHELVEFCARIPPSLKMKGLNEKYILRRALQTFLPPEILRRKKRGLTAPFQQWLREKLPEFAEEMLSEACIRSKGYFNPDCVALLLKTHRSGREGYGKYLMGVLVIHLWDELFLRRPFREMAS